MSLTSASLRSEVRNQNHKTEKTKPDLGPQFDIDLTREEKSNILSKLFQVKVRSDEVRSPRNRSNFLDLDQTRGLI
jgi:hypothetical protein